MAQDEVILDGDAQLDLQLDGAVGLLTLIEAGIAQIIFNDDYTITFVLTDGREFTTGSVRGAVGAKGDKGDKGDAGEQGETGPQGIQGERGEKGEKGDTGAQGIQGEKGDTGPQGPKGDTGEAGPKGDQGDDYILTQQDKEDIAGLVDVPVTDVQINGTSIVQDGVAEIPVASLNTRGITKAGNGLQTTSEGDIRVEYAGSTTIKTATNSFNPITPKYQHESTFYGLAKAAGDSTQSASSNAVGNYTDAAKVAIQKMLGIYEAPWELIREDTFTNETEADHIITVDSNGQAFELTDLVMRITIPKNTAISITAYGIVEFYYNNGNTYLSAELGAQSNTQSYDRYGWVQLKQNNGLREFMFTKYVASGTSGGLNLQGPNPIALDNLLVYKIRFRPLTGSISYKLYGKRNWQ